jgi:hypothetical protein
MLDTSSEDRSNSWDMSLCARNATINNSGRKAHGSCIAISYVTEREIRTNESPIPPDRVQKRETLPQPAPSMVGTPRNREDKFDCHEPPKTRKIGADISVVICAEYTARGDIKQKARWIARGSQLTPHQQTMFPTT